MENSELAIFENEQFGRVRVTMIDGDAWFVATDVASALGYEKPNNAINTHCKKINKFSYPDSRQGAQPYNIIPISDVLRLVMRSNLPKAVEFQDWVVEEVLPSILKTGGYAIGGPASCAPFENIFDRVQPLDMLDAIYQYRRAGDVEKAQVLAQNWERNFGFPVFEEKQGLSADMSILDDTSERDSQIQTPSSKEQLLTPAKIGSFLSPQLTGKEVNNLLCKMKLQKMDHKGYLPTPKGTPYTPGRTQYAVNLRWKMEIIDVIKTYIQNQRIGNSFSL